MISQWWSTRVWDTVTDLAATTRRLIREDYLERIRRAPNASHAILPLVEPGHFRPRGIKLVDWLPAGTDRADDLASDRTLADALVFYAVDGRA